MLPYYLMGASSFLGLVIWGLPGFLIGSVGGYLLVFLLGIVSDWIIGGFVPRKVRRDIAVNFITKHQALMGTAFPDLSGAERLKTVEKSIEYIYRTSHERDRSLDLTSADKLGSIQEATQAIVENEQKPEMKEFYSALLQQIEKDSY